MAKKYIDKEIAIEKLCDRCGECLTAKGKDCAIVRIMDKVPTADVAPVIHAHWTTKERYHGTLFGDCSNCGASSVADAYCSNCGARMDEVIDDA